VKFLCQTEMLGPGSSDLNPASSTCHLLLVEDDAELAAMVCDFLTANGFEVRIEADGTRAAERILHENYDIVVLDIGLPGMDGISICRLVRSEFAGPIVMLTARGDEIDEVVAIEVGADDYVAKPVRPRALLARLKMHLRKSTSDRPGAASSIEVDGLRIDAPSRTVQLDERSIELTTAEFDLLWFLASHAGEVVERHAIYKELLGIPYDGLDRSIDLRVSRLRKKLGDDSSHPTRIKSVRGVGYILATES
jgi:two-component system OmpR family response regulator/two-component system response regulator RstA